MWHQSKFICDTSTGSVCVRVCVHKRACYRHVQFYSHFSFVLTCNWAQRHQVWPCSGSVRVCCVSGALAWNWNPVNAFRANMASTDTNAGGWERRSCWKPKRETPLIHSKHGTENLSFINPFILMIVSNSWHWERTRENERDKTRTGGFGYLESFYSMAPGLVAT